MSRRSRVSPAPRRTSSRCPAAAPARLGCAHARAARGRAGRAEFVTRDARARRPDRRVADALRPRSVRAGAAAAAQPADRAHASRARGRARAAGGRARARSDPRQRPSTASTSSAPTGSSPLPIAPRRRPHIARSRSRTASPVYLAATEGFRRAGLHGRALRDRGGAGATSAAGRADASGAVGRLIPIKGFDVLLGAFASRAARLSAPCARDRRRGPLEAELRAHGAGRRDVPRPRRAGQAVYERNAIVVVPSRGEGFGMVALEAAERGRATIVSDVGGLPEIVADGETGPVVPAGGRGGTRTRDRRARARRRARAPVRPRRATARARFVLGRSGGRRRRGRFPRADAPALRGWRAWTASTAMQSSRVTSSARSTTPCGARSSSCSNGGRRGSSSRRSCARLTPRPARTRSCGSSARARAAQLRRSATTRTGEARRRRARPAGVDAAAVIARRDRVAARARARAALVLWRRLVPRRRLAEALAALGYVDCSATTFRQPYLADDAPRLQLPGAAPAPAALGGAAARAARDALARHARPRLLSAACGPVHLHFHDWELVDPRRSLALHALLRVLRLRRRPLRDRRSRRAGRGRAGDSPGPALRSPDDRVVPAGGGRPRSAHRTTCPPSPFKTMVRRLLSILDAADDRRRGTRDRALRGARACARSSSTRSRSSGGCSGRTRRDWLPFLILLLVLVFWRAGPVRAA